MKTSLTRSALLEALAALPRDPVRPLARETGRRQAAVALVLREDDPLDLLLIKRATNPRDPWSGHMALPGGRLEPGDLDLRATAVRETHEETGLLLDTASTYLGRLPNLEPVSRQIPPVSVSPHVFLAPGRVEAVVASHEVASTHWVPLDTLLHPDTVGEVQIPIPGGPRAFPCYRVEGQVVWGMTYRILTDFLGRL
jgi:8-oxo-dGTP pyrophosphatase MutT (NUDIX family)